MPAARSARSTTLDLALVVRNTVGAVVGLFVSFWYTTDVEGVPGTDALDLAVGKSPTIFCIGFILLANAL